MWTFALSENLLLGGYEINLYLNDVPAGKALTFGMLDEPYVIRLTSSQSKDSAYRVAEVWGTELCKQYNTKAIA